MSRFIDADEYKNVLEKLRYRGIFPQSRDVIILRNYLDEFPTADAAKVVRCKDCIYYQSSLFGERKMCFRKDVDGVQICYDFSPDDYCSYGIKEKL